jgi:hypothetical protein
MLKFNFPNHPHIPYIYKFKCINPHGKYMQHMLKHSAYIQRYNQKALFRYHNCLVFVAETEFFLCQVRNDFLYSIYMTFSPQNASGGHLLASRRDICCKESVTETGDSLLALKSVILTICHFTHK